MVQLKVEKSADKSYVFLGISNKIKYSIVITNTGDSKATCVKVRDVMSKGAYFIPGTFMINGCSQDLCHLEDNISVGSIRPGGNILVNFDVEVVNCNPPTEIRNKAIVTCCDCDTNILVTESKEIVTPVISICVDMKKMVDESVVKIGQILSYSVLIRNNSNIKLDNVILYDHLPKSVELLPASVLIDLKPQYIENFNGGLPLGTMNAYSSIIVNFQVKVICLPEPTLVKNTAKIEFSYTISDNGIPITSFGQSCSNEVVTKVLNNTWTC